MENFSKVKEWRVAEKCLNCEEPFTMSGQLSGEAYSKCSWCNALTKNPRVKPQHWRAGLTLPRWLMIFFIVAILTATYTWFLGGASWARPYIWGILLFQFLFLAVMALSTWVIVEWTRE
ncbi:MAG: hypothetical protein EXR62_08195 [Chloroflexi bacterium]|nr:hypothetical protein [Chloroflexota bacterium]